MNNSAFLLTSPASVSFDTNTYFMRLVAKIDAEALNYVGTVAQHFSHEELIS